VLIHHLSQVASQAIQSLAHASQYRELVGGMALEDRDGSDLAVPQAARRLDLLALVDYAFD